MPLMREDGFALYPCFCFICRGTKSAERGDDGGGEDEEETENRERGVL